MTSAYDDIQFSVVPNERRIGKSVGRRRSPAADAIFALLLEGKTVLVTDTSVSHHIRSGLDYRIKQAGISAKTRSAATADGALMWIEVQE